MRLNRTLLGWGVFLLLLGAIPIAVRQGLIPESTAEQAWRLWPLLLVAWGVGLVLRRTPVEFLAGLAGAALLGAILGSVVATGSLPIGCGGDRAGTGFAHPRGQLAGTATVELTLHCGELTVRPEPGADWTLTGVADEAPRITAGPSELAIESRRQSGFGFAGSRETWQVGLPTEPTIDLELEVNAGTADVDLAGAHLGRVAANVNAGSIKLDLGRAAALRELDVEMNASGDPQVILPALSFAGSIEANAAGNVRICPPSGAALRLTVEDNVASGHNFEARGLVRNGDRWETVGFDAATVRIELALSVNAGSFNLEPEGSCHG